jgi:hypothetical protein
MPQDGTLGWYPRVTAFAQGSPGQWSEPVAQLRAHLAERLAAR